MALILIVLALLGFGVLGAGSSSTGTSPPTKAKPRVHHMNCKARMSSGESRRDDCGGPPANP